MEKILTIVVPSYNAEAYLRDNLESFCIDEIVNDIDVLVVNDGSTDRTAAIAEEYVEKYPDTFRIITKENGGHGSGINCGIKHAFGKYFKVVDADDWVDRDAFVKLIQVLKKKNSDIVYSGFFWVFDDGCSLKKDFKRKAETKIPFAAVDYNKEYYFDDIADKLYIKMHNMTIKTDILKNHGIKIDEHCYYVDMEYITYPIPYVKTISFVDSFVYMYRIGRQGQSVGIEKMQKNEENYDKVIRSLLAFYSKLGDQIPCSVESKNYIAGMIARVVAGKIKIMLSFPASNKKKEELVAFDQGLLKMYPDIYRRNVNRAVLVLRKSNYCLYYLASAVVKKKYR